MPWRCYVCLGRLLIDLFGSVATESNERRLPRFMLLYTPADLPMDTSVSNLVFHVSWWLSAAFTHPYHRAGFSNCHILVRPLLLNKFSKTISL